MASSPETTILDISKLKVPDLKKELRARGLVVSGNKTELTQRLQAALSSDKLSASMLELSQIDDDDDDSDAEADLLNDDDLEQEHLVTSDSVLTEIDKQIEQATSTAPKRKAEPSSSSNVPKKIVLNRASVNEDHIPTPSSGSDNQVVTVVKTIEEDVGEEKKVIKVSELSAKERLEMRAKKFGVVQSDVAKKVIRAERFNVSSSLSSTGATANLDVLRKRAERFGISTSKTVTSVENDEKLKKRKARFGTAQTANGSSAASNEEKAKLRLERFKTPVA